MKKNMIGTFEGSYGRDGVIYIELEDCVICGTHANCLTMDGSENEYYNGAICEKCIIEAFKKVKE